MLCKTLSTGQPNVLVCDCVQILCVLMSRRRVAFDLRWPARFLKEKKDNNFSFMCFSCGYGVIMLTCGRFIQDILAFFSDDVIKNGTVEVHMLWILFAVNGQYYIYIDLYVKSKKNVLSLSIVKVL